MALVVLNIGDAVDELPVPVLLLVLIGDCGLPVDGDCLDLLDDLVRVLPLGILFLSSLSASILTTSSGSSFSILISVLSGTTTTSVESLSPSFSTPPCSWFS